VEVLAAVGGCEFGAMAGAMLAGAARGWAVIVDGYIAGAAALLALALDPKVRDFLVWSHRSAEPGARLLLESLGLEPVLDLSLRLGEGTGAALAVPILRSAAAVLREMATFSGAGVSNGVERGAN
jgi:nicotinate-nucleotide--dimethylbenzimidazole phosphoribosyltransferase